MATYLTSSIPQGIFPGEVNMEIFFPEDEEIARKKADPLKNDYIPIDEVPDDGTCGGFLVRINKEDEELLYDELRCVCDDITNSNNISFATNENQHTKKADFDFANDVAAAVCPTSTKRNITTSPHVCGMCKLNYNEQRRLLGLGRSDYPRSRMQRKRGKINPCRIRKERHEKLRALFAYERYMKKLDREREFLLKF